MTSYPVNNSVLPDLLRASESLVVYISVGEVKTISLNSCLATVGSLDGMSITTVEGIGNSSSLHGVQGALLVWRHDYHLQNARHHA